MDNTQMQINLEKLAAAIAGHIDPQVPFDKQLWNAKQCAKYMNKSYSRFMQNFASHPTFPRRINLPIRSGGQSSPLWRAKEVVEWVLMHQEKRK